MPMWFGLGGWFRFLLAKCSPISKVLRQLGDPVYVQRLGTFEKASISYLVTHALGAKIL